MSCGEYYCSLCGFLREPCIYSITDTDQVMRLRAELAALRAHDIAAGVRDV